MEKIVEWFEEEKHHSYASAPAGKGDDAQVLVFMIHGWPDDMDLWKDWVEPLNNDGMDVLRVLLPGYENDEAAAKESVKLLKEAGNKVLVLRDALHEFALKKANGKSIVIVGHDWGAAFAYMLDQKYPDFAERIVTIDVGPRWAGKPFALELKMFSKTWNLNLLLLSISPCLWNLPLWLSVFFIAHLQWKTLSAATAVHKTFS